MNRFDLLVLSLIVISMSGCGQGVASSQSTEEILAVEDQAGLLAGLRAAGATAEIGDPVFQDFFAPEGSLITVNGADVQVFEYETADEMVADASQVAPDGGSVGTSMMMWMDAPHFYKAGRIIVLYIGSDQAILNLLEKVLGPQFAGQ